MQKKYRLLLIVSIIGLLAVLSTGTYAYLRKTPTQTNYNQITTLSCLDIDLDNITNGINLINDYPISDTEGVTRTPYTFSVTNNCATYIDTSINLESLSLQSNQLSREYVKASINIVGDDPEVVALNSSTNTTATITDALSNELYNIVIGPNATKNFELRLWIDENVTNTQGMNKNYEGKVVVLASATNKYAWGAGANNSLLYALGNDPLNTVRKPLTVPGKRNAFAYSTHLIYRDEYADSLSHNEPVDHNSMFTMPGQTVTASGIRYEYGAFDYCIPIPCGEDIATVQSGNSFCQYYEVFQGLYVDIPGVGMSVVNSADYDNETFTYTTVGNNQSGTYTYACYTSQDYYCSYNYEGTIYADTIEDYINGNTKTVYDVSNESLLSGKIILATINNYDIAVVKYVEYVDPLVSGNNCTLVVEPTQSTISYANSYSDLVNGVNVTTGNYSDLYSNLAGKYMYYNSYGYIEATNNKPVVGVVSATADNIRVVQALDPIDVLNYPNGESLVSTAKDDYGTSYYFRGINITNNYVSFAHKCWRVVRVDGMGNIKLILENDNYNNTYTDANVCDIVASIGNYGLAKDSTGGTIYVKFNALDNSNAYVGWMYGTPGSLTFAAEHANTNKSAVLVALEDWYERNMTSYSSKLADVVWCNDISIASSTFLQANSKYSSYSNNGYGSSATVYSAYERLGGSIYVEPESITGPTYKCSNSNSDITNLMRFTVSNAYGNGLLTYKVGLMTADEVAYSGLSYLNGNVVNTFLASSGGSPWTMTPAYYDGNHAWEFTINLRAGVTVNNQIKPMIALKGDATFSSGNGTKTNPYMID